MFASKIIFVEKTCVSIFRVVFAFHFVCTVLGKMCVCVYLYL